MISRYKFVRDISRIGWGKLIEYDIYVPSRHTSETINMSLHGVWIGVRDRSEFNMIKYQPLIV